MDVMKKETENINNNNNNSRAKSINWADSARDLATGTLASIGQGNGVMEGVPDSPGSVYCSSIASSVKVDRYGFIFEESNGNDDVTEKSSTSGHRLSLVNISELEGKKRREKEWTRERKWIKMIRDWKNVNKAKRKKLKRRIRKGIPDAARGHVWMEICGVREKTKANPQVYESKHVIYGENNIMETIERDITRTYPRHLFFADPSMSETIQETSSYAGVTVASNEEVSVATDAVTKKRLFCQDSSRILPSKKTDVMVGSVLDAFSCKIKYTPTEDEQSMQHIPAIRAVEDNNFAVEESFVEEVLGQTLLRRVLRAYANYDEEVGYCQGMGFIAGMFLTYMPEEEAFWQLVGM